MTLPASWARGVAWTVPSHYPRTVEICWFAVLGLVVYRLLCFATEIWMLGNAKFSLLSVRHIKILSTGNIALPLFRWFYYVRTVNVVLGSSICSDCCDVSTIVFCKWNMSATDFCLFCYLCRVAKSCLVFFSSFVIKVTDLISKRFQFCSLFHNQVLNYLHTGEVHEFLARHLSAHLPLSRSDKIRSKCWILWTCQVNVVSYC